LGSLQNSALYNLILVIKDVNNNFVLIYFIIVVIFNFLLK